MVKTTQSIKQTQITTIPLIFYSKFIECKGQSEVVTTQLTPWLLTMHYMNKRVTLLTEVVFSLKIQLLECQPLLKKKLVDVHCVLSPNLNPSAKLFLWYYG